jgi:hypothetical protein
LGFGVGHGFEGGVAFFEGVGNVFEEDEAEDDALVVGGEHDGAVFGEDVGGIAPTAPLI